MQEATISRKTGETDITVRVGRNLPGDTVISTGIGFFDHMLCALAKHSGLTLSVQSKGDLEVDCHHTVEDTGIVLGQALGKLFGDKSGICRYGTAFIPMDEALGFASLDISGRPYLVFDCAFSSDTVGAFDTQMTEEFFRAVAFHAGITLHLRCEYGTNDHHKIEALFKAFAHALKAACAENGDGTVLSTKGTL